MSEFALAVAAFLLLTLVAGMIRVVRGPTAADRMLAAQLFGTTGVAVLLLLAQAGKNEALVNVALVLALLAAVVGVTFINRGVTGRSDNKERTSGRD
jgi:multicomponent Na+:H+ antiporter subunit F